MNIGGIKTFLGGQDGVSPDKAIKEQLQASGLKQAREFYENNNTFSSRFSVAYSALSESFRQNIELDGEKQSKSAPSNDEDVENEGVFDFEEVANNVFSFVGRVIRNAADSGADDDTLNSLFDQARDGIDRGISAAKQDLSGLLTDDLSDGIKKVAESLDDKLSRLEEDIFAPVDSSSALQANISAFAGAEFYIKTKDGDEISVQFGQSQSYSYSAEQTQTAAGTSDSDTADSTVNSYIQYLERLGVSLTVRGDLDEDELVAISDLITQISEVADSFFTNDIQGALEKALELGYNQEELVGFSLQLVQTQSSSATRAYEDIQNYKQQDSASVLQNAESRSVIEYVDEMLKSLERSNELLQSREDYTQLINSVVNELDDEVKLPDLVSAINRFHQFNEDIVKTASQLNT